MGRAAFAWAAALMLALAGGARAQDGETPAPAVPEATAPVAAVVILDTERLFTDSRYAATLRAEIEADAAIIKAENDALVEQLTAEEQSLTERRPDMTPEAFRAEAEAFDQKVQRIRNERDAKEAELQAAQSELRLRFFDEVRPIVGRLMVDRGALAVIDSRSIVVARRAADITDDAITLVDDTLLPVAEDAGGDE